jgi:hypothetical protein
MGASIEDAGNVFLLSTVPASWLVFTHDNDAIRAFYRTPMRCCTLGPSDRTGRDARVRLWFWGWLVVAVSVAIVAAVARDRSSAPFSIGAASAAALEAAGGTPGSEWLVFIGVSCVLFVAMNRRAYRPRHGRNATGRHAARRDRTEH